MAIGYARDFAQEKISPLSRRSKFLIRRVESADVFDGFECRYLSGAVTRESTGLRCAKHIGHALRSQTNERQATEVAIAVDVLNRTPELGRPSYVRIA